MGWFKTEEEIQETKVILEIEEMNPRRAVSKIEEEGEFVTIELRTEALPVVSFSEEEDSEEKENVSTIHISNISE